jgi:hypothetical protein
MERRNFVKTIIGALSAPFLLLLKGYANLVIPKRKDVAEQVIPTATTGYCATINSSSNDVLTPITYTGNTSGVTLDSSSNTFCCGNFIQGECLVPGCEDKYYHWPKGRLMWIDNRCMGDLRKYPNAGIETYGSMFHPSVLKQEE